MSNAKFLDKILEKWPVKVISLTAAIILVVYYRMSTLETRSFSVSLLVETNNKFIPSSSFTDTVKVSLRGEANSINSIPEKDIEAYIDLNKYTNDGVYRIPVQIRKKGGALGIEPLEITVLPAEISLTLEQKIVRNIPVYPVFRGTIAHGYELTSQSIIPDTVTAEGPRSILENQYDFLTETIDIEGRYGNFSILINIINENPLVVIHGNKMIEYRGTIRRITREALQDSEVGDDE
ncbi:MAG: CdaR family protein [Spirochaetes bacterium]|nr:CdaR family protein [Spirochaetota bacterium]